MWKGARYLVHSRRTAGEYTDMGSCLYISAVSQQMAELLGVEKWRFDDEIYVACYFVIICLIVKMWFIYLSKS